MGTLSAKETEGKNTVGDLKEFFSTSENPVSSAEFKEFWVSCTEAEREEFRQAELPK